MQLFFPDPLLLRDCGPIRPSARGPPRTLTGCLTAGDTVLLPTPRDCSRAAARPRESSRDRVAAEPQGVWTITTHIWCEASAATTLFQHQRMWLFSQVHWSLCLLWGEGAHSLYQVSSQQANRLSPCGPKTPGLHSAPGDPPFPPEHRQVRSCDVSDSVLPLFIGGI